MIAEGDAGSLRLLLEQVGDGAAPVFDRLGLTEGPIAPRQRDPWRIGRILDRPGAPASALLWMLESDLPELRTVVFQAARTSLAVRRDILLGLPYAPGATERVPVRQELRQWYAMPEFPLDGEDFDLIAELYAVRTMTHGRHTANAVTRRDWPRIASADRDRPLPGYARWNLSIRIDCPPALREQFGDHPKFRHRLRQAGVVAGPREYVESWRPAHQVLQVLALGAWAFPHRLEEALEPLRPLIDALGPSPEAWAVLAQLLPTFSGTVPELLVTTRAISGV
ncbi:hypothetical protein AB0M28_08845 [Streptomyces sp. NPDC051940]|uniref:hypothetical protein n=1 Tax=Streptomyces sp. NPDC051940 TaxID=3155675 RepID=UPI0034157F0A